MDKIQLIDILRKEGFSEKILKAFEKVKREDFIDEYLKDSAYLNEPLPIGGGVTISQPYTIAFMLDLLRLNNINNVQNLRDADEKLSLKKADKKKINNINNKNNIKILEIGSGSGYVLALINEMCDNCEIYGVERIKELVDKSKQVLKDKKNIQIFNKNGINGLEKYAPYDRILVSAAGREIPKEFVSQLKDNGILVCVVNNSIVVLEKKHGGNKIESYPGFVFVRLVDGD